MNILFIINDGFEESETITPFDMLKRAGYNVVIASNGTEAKGAHGITIKNLTLLNTLNKNDFDCLVLPGGPQWNKNKDDALYLEYANFFAKNKIIASICASPTILGNLGLLYNIKYTCFPPLNNDFGGIFTGDKATIDKNIITSRSAGTALEFGAAIIEKLESKEKAIEVLKAMYY